MPKFFSKYPKINYDLELDGSTYELTNISRAVILNIDKSLDDLLAYTYYNILDGDRPDIISYKLYGTIDYYWTFFILNNSLREGLLAAWPLSENNLQNMIEREYGKYSVLSLLPIKDPNEELNNELRLDISCIPLDTKYLKYINLCIANHKSKIVKYDSRRHQLILSDIYKVVDGARIQSAAVTAAFIKEAGAKYTIEWDDSQEDTDAAALKAEWIDAVYQNITKYDYDGAPDIPTATPTAGRMSIKQNYISDKYLHSARPTFCWPDARNAAYEYYSADNQETLTAYDVLTNVNVIEPKYKSFFEYETEINDAKRSIRVARKDSILDFADKYFDALINKST